MLRDQWFLFLKLNPKNYTESPSLDIAYPTSLLCPIWLTNLAKDLMIIGERAEISDLVSPHGEI